MSSSIQSPEPKYDRFTVFLARFTQLVLGLALCITIIGLPWGIKVIRDLFRRPLPPEPASEDTSWDPVSESLVNSWDDFTMSGDDE